MRSSSLYPSSNLAVARFMAFLTSGARYPKLMRAEAASSWRKLVGSIGADEGLWESEIMMRLVLSFNSRTIRLADFFPTPGMEPKVSRSPVSMAVHKSGTERVDNALKASFGPTPLMVVRSEKACFSSVVENPKS